MQEPNLPIAVDLFLAVPMVAEFPMPPVDGRRMRHCYTFHIDSQGESDKQLLERVFHMFNIDHPSDYFHRSFSAGDVVTLGHVRSYVCDALGWTKLEFVLLYPGAEIEHPTNQQVVTAPELDLGLVGTDPDSIEIVSRAVEKPSVIQPIDGPQQTALQVLRMYIVAILRRVRCVMLGCLLAESQFCGCCGVTFYDNKFVNQGVVSRLVPWHRISEAFARTRWLLAHRCDHCQHWMFFRDEYVCSPECAEDWIPF